MNKKQLIAEIDKVIRGVETDRFTLENLDALRTKVIDAKVLTN